MLTAAIDVGSNSTRLLVADVNGTIVSPVSSDMKITRLGKGILGKRLMQESMAKTIAAVKDFVAHSRGLGAEKIIIAATSAVRDAENGTNFCEAVYTATGLPLRVLSGIEEARLSYWGVVSGIENHEDAAVIDIGGGSTEFIWLQGEVPQFISVNAGAVRMTEGNYGVEKVRDVLSTAIAAIKGASAGSLIGVGGTVTTLAAMSQNLLVYDREKIHGYKLTLADVEDIYRRLTKLSLEQRRQMPGLQPERADIIPAGTLILREILYGLGMEYLIVSEADILYGLALQCIGE